VDLTDKACTLIPIPWKGGGVRTTNVDLSGVPCKVQLELYTQLENAGLQMRTGKRDEGHPSAGLVVKCEIRRADPGSRTARYEWGPFGGAAVVEVSGQVFDGPRPLDFLTAEGKRRFALFFGGSSESMLLDAAKLAGRHLADQILDSLEKM
jgi:hypothetical protein